MVPVIFNPSLVCLDKVNFSLSFVEMPSLDNAYASQLSKYLRNSFSSHYMYNTIIAYLSYFVLVPLA